MMMHFESSIFLRYLKKIKQNYLAIENRLSPFYLKSFTHQLLARVFRSIKFGFRFSIFGRLTEIKQDVPINFLKTSKIKTMVLNSVMNLKNELTSSSAVGIFFIFIRTLKRNFLSSPIKAAGIIIITTIITNLYLSIQLQKQIALWGWVVRALLLFIGINGLFCDVNWEDTKRTSFVLRKVQQ